MGGLYFSDCTFIRIFPIIPMIGINEFDVLGLKEERKKRSKKILKRKRKKVGDLGLFLNILHTEKSKMKNLKNNDENR